MQKSIYKYFVAILMIVSGLPLLASLDPATLNSAGEEAFASKDFIGAAENFAKALKYSPEDLRARFRYGQALFSLNRFSESHNQFQAILQNSPNNIIARIYLAENLLQLNRHQEARDHITWILRVQPEHERAQQILADLNGRKTVVGGPLEKMPKDLKPLPVKPVKGEVVASKKEMVSKEKPVAKQSAVVQNSKNQIPAATKSVARKEKTGAPVLTAVSAKNLDIAEFVKANQNSFLVNLEQAKFCLENNQVAAANGYLKKADELARNSRDQRRFLEVQILKSLVYVYSRDFKAFGQHLMSLKPVLSPQSYQSFLDIYNKGSEIKDSVEQARLSAGIAMGAGHHAVASALLSEAYNKFPNDPLIANFLADAQMQSLDYRGAEATLAGLARADSKSAEAYFNLARFYLTVFYKPDQARSYAAYAASLKPDDSRILILLALVDYSEGKISEGVARIKKQLPMVEDPSLKAICEKIMADGHLADAAMGSNRVNFAGILALPGAPHAPLSAYVLLGEDYLKRGSFLTAMKYFVAAQDLAEVGRTYLGIASALNSAGEKDAAALAAGYGLQALEQELSVHNRNNRAHLYLALFHYDRGDKVAARKSIERGLAVDGESLTRQRLTAMLNSIDNS